MARTYARAWRNDGIRLAASLVGWVTVIPVSMLTEATHQAWLRWSWIAGCVAAGVWWQSFRCPRCGRGFRANWIMRNGFARRCIHCGLPAGAAPDPCNVCDRLAERLDIGDRARLAEIAASILPILREGRLDQVSGSLSAADVAAGRWSGGRLTFRCARCRFEYRLRANAAATAGAWELMGR